MSLLFSLIKRHFFMHFYVPFQFLKVPFDLVCLPRGAFRKAKGHRGTTKRGKMSLPFFSNRTAFCHALDVPFHFLKVSFHFAYL